MYFISCFFPLLLLICFIINTFYLMRNSKRKIIETNKDKSLNVKCEKCGNEHPATIEEAFSTLMAKRSKITISVSIGGLGGSLGKYNYYAKKFFCPQCQKKTYSKIINYNELAINNTKIMIIEFLKFIIKMLIAIWILSILSNILEFIISLFK